jgi:hypothetical protein
MFNPTAKNVAFKSPAKNTGQAGEAGHAVEHKRKNAHSPIFTILIPPGWNWRTRNWMKPFSRPMAGLSDFFVSREPFMASHDFENL